MASKCEFNDFTKLESQESLLNSLFNSHHLGGIIYIANVDNSCFSNKKINLFYGGGLGVPSAEQINESGHFLNFKV